jgi:DNA-binding NarL/FixJ family response regulator
VTNRKVLVLEDDPLVRAEVAARVAAEPGFELLGEAGTVAEARRLLAQGPALAVFDLHLPDGNALGIIGEARAAGVQVLVFTISADDQDVYRALAAGAGGYLLKSDATVGVGPALALLRDGGAPTSPRIARWLMDDFRARAGSEPDGQTPALTPREREVLELFGSGATYAEVARALGMSVNTVREHVRHLYEKLHVASKTEAVLRARALGLSR